MKFRSKILIINSADKNISEFYTSIESILKTFNVDFQTINYTECNSVDIDKYAGVIITGSPQGDDIVETHQKYFRWIKDYEKPIIGICAGHHIIGFLYGANYLRSIEPESGKNEIEIIENDRIFSNLNQKFEVHQMHNDSITLPDNFIHLAKSNVCFNQAMKHEKKDIYSFQFHPEYFNHEIFGNFINIVEQ